LVSIHKAPADTSITGPPDYSPAEGLSVCLAKADAVTPAAWKAFAGSGLGCAIDGIEARFRLCPGTEQGLN